MGLLPASTDLAWWHEDVLDHAEILHWYRGRVRFLTGGPYRASGFFTGAPALLVQRLLAGVASAWVFVAGGLLAAQLRAAAALRSARKAEPVRIQLDPLEFL